MERVGGIPNMNNRDWDFLMGDFGDPLADIEDYMIPPFLHKQPNKEDKSNDTTQNQDGR